MKENNFRPVLSVFLKTDYRDKEANTKKKFTGILLAYLISNLFLSYTYNLIFDEQSYIIMTITASVFMISFIVLNDFDNLFLANKSFDILAVLPLDNTEVFSAKFLSGFTYLLFFFVSLVIPQVIFFINFEPSLYKVLLFISVNFTFSFTAAGILLLIYIFTLYKFFKKAGTLVILLQFLFFLFVVFSATLPSSSAGIAESGLKRSIVENSFIKFSPQYFYASAVDNVLLIFPILITFIFIYVIIFKFISAHYLSLLEKVNRLKKTSTKAKRKIRLNIFEKLGEKIYKGNDTSLAAYKLTSWQLSNSRFLRVKYTPMVFLPVIFAVSGFVLDIPGLLVFRESGSLFPDGSFLMLGPTVSLTLIMSARLLISNTKILDEHSVNTGWIYDTLPVKSAKNILNGANGFIYINFILPVILLIFFLLLIRTGFITSFINILYISTAILFINSIFNIFSKNYPFTLESNKFNSAAKLIEIIISITAGIIIFTIQIFIFQNIIFVLTVSLLFIAVTYFLNRN